MNSQAERIAQLLDELGHADGLILRLVAENEQLHAELAGRNRVIAELRHRVAEGRPLAVVEGGKSPALHIG